MMIILKSEGCKDKLLLTLQPRVPVASLAFPELPAGMLDGSGNFAGTAAKEIYEETGRPGVSSFSVCTVRRKGIVS